MTGLRLRALAVAVSAASLLTLAATAPCRAQSSVHPAWISSPPPIDGDADAQAWRSGAHLQIESSSGRTDAYLLEDAQYLYVAVRAAQRERITAKSLADETPLDGEDAVTLQFATTAGHVAFRANPFGAHDALSSADPKFAPAWKSAGRILSGAYEVTMRIPRDLFPARAECTVSLARRIAGSGQRLHSEPLAFHNAGQAFSTIPAHVVAGEAGKFSGRYRSLWPSERAPQIPDTAAGVAVKRSAGDVTVAALDAQSGDRDDNAQSVVYTSPDSRISSTVQRVESTQADVRDVVQSLSFLYDNQSDLSVSGGLAVDRAVRSSNSSEGNYAFTEAQYHSGKSSADLFWSSAGPQYDPQDDIGTSAGTNGFTVHANHQFGAVTLEGAADAYRDDIGTLMNSDNRATLSVPLGSHFSAGISSASNYSQAIGAFNENGLHLGYDAHPASGSIEYRTGSYEDGFLQDAGITAGFNVPVLGSLNLEHRQRNFWNFEFPETTQMLDSVRMTHRLNDGMLSLSYRNVTGTLPPFLADAAVAGTGVSISLDRYVKLGLLHFSYNESTALFSAPSFSLKIIPGARP